LSRHRYAAPAFESWQAVLARWNAGQESVGRLAQREADQAFDPDSKCSRLLVAFRVKVSLQFSNSHDNQLLSRHCERSEAIHLAA